MRKLILFMVLASSLSGCVAYEAGSAVVDVASTAVSTTADVACDIACLIDSDDKDR